LTLITLIHSNYICLKLRINKIVDSVILFLKLYYLTLECLKNFFLFRLDWKDIPKLGTIGSYFTIRFDYLYLDVLRQLSLVPNLDARLHVKVYSIGLVTSDSANGLSTFLLAVFIYLNCDLTMSEQQ
jgi:hypothetical protein